MTKTKGSNFWLGFWLGAALCALIWYWQKSTSADEGALNLLDELANVQAKLHHIEVPPVARPIAEPPTASPVTPAPTATSPVSAAPDDLTLIHGIGPVYARRLQEAGIHTFADLAALAPEKIAEIVGLREWQAASPLEWIADAQARASAQAS
ncbi:MAG: hypothetical protein KC413_17395 [Anaerolineales bacterium]|nr:hypothetical protein [Anaerolineales bacterium]MCB8966399.1 hypothetical protein [Ardenticatenaceae bacterium]